MVNGDDGWIDIDGDDDAIVVSRAQMRQQAASERLVVIQEATISLQEDGDE